MKTEYFILILMGMNYYDSIALMAAERSEVAAKLSEHAANISWNAAIITFLAALIGIVGPIVVYVVKRRLDDKRKQAELLAVFTSVSDKLALSMAHGNEHKEKFDLVMLELSRMEQNERVKFLQDNGITDIVAFYEWLEPHCPGWPVSAFGEYVALKGKNET